MNKSDSISDINLCKYFCVHDFIVGPDTDPYQKFLLAFTVPLILSPWSYGPLFAVIMIIILEFIIIMMTWGTKDYHPEVRVGVILCAILGWIVGRTIIGVPHFHNEEDRQHLNDFFNCIMRPHYPDGREWVIRTTH